MLLPFGDGRFRAWVISVPNLITIKAQKVDHSLLCVSTPSKGEHGEDSHVRRDPKFEDFRRVNVLGRTIPTEMFLEDPNCGLG